MLVPVDGAGPVVELRPPPFEYGEPGYAQMQFSPDGKNVIANFGDSTPSWLLDTTGGRARRGRHVDSGAVACAAGRPPQPSGPARVLPGTDSRPEAVPARIFNRLW